MRRTEPEAQIPGTSQIGAAARVNFGCGSTPTPGWENFDNSPAVQIAKLPRPLRVLFERFVEPESRRFIAFAIANDIRWADSTRRFPFEDETVGVIYSSHMLEHLDREEVRCFLCEVKRVLIPGGHIRLVLPDLKKLTEDYIASGDADAYIGRLHTCVSKPSSLRDKLRTLVAGPRHHHWMYDSASITRLLCASGFVDVEDLGPGATRIANPGLLDLSERADESLFVEARQPRG